MSRYVWTFAGLLALTGLTLWLSFLGLGAWSTPVAMVIAGAKSALVVLFFMHLVEEATSSRLALVVALLLAGLLIGLAALDVGTRTEPADGAGGPATPGAVARLEEASEGPSGSSDGHADGAEDHEARAVLNLELRTDGRSE